MKKGSSSSTLKNHVNFSLGPSSSPSRFIPQIAQNKNELQDSTFSSLKRSRDGVLKMPQVHVNSTMLPFWFTIWACQTFILILLWFIWNLFVEWRDWKPYSKLGSPYEFAKNFFQEGGSWKILTVPTRIHCSLENTCEKRMCYTPKKHCREGMKTI